MNITKPIGLEITLVDFSVLLDEETRTLSAKQLTNPQVFDNLGHPVSNGLYDLALGAFLRNTCATCGLDERGGCPGHQGHIELPVPVYNPLFFTQVYNLVRGCCVHCQRFKISKVETNLYECQLRLLQYGLLEKIEEVARIGADMASDEAEEGEEDNDAVQDLAHTALLIEKRELFVAQCISETTSLPPTSSLLLQERKKIIKQFYTRLASRTRCFNCKLYLPSYRRDGSVKLFEKPLPEKQALYNRAHSAKNKAGTQGSKYVLCSEVKALLLSVFKAEQGFVDVLFNLRPAKKHVSADIFFRNTLVVPPTRFRLPSKLGEEVHENPTNELLSKILKTCLVVKAILSDLIALKTKSVLAEDKKTLFSRLMNLFVTLQNDVNTFVDSLSSSQTNPPPGIKQALEKKEGLFRKHMMGKRVNYAARSVISPDPMLETDEVGVPPVFATRLSFPEPVGPHNAHAMRQAVQNGADIWPGALLVQNEDGSVILLRGMGTEQRKALADQLLTPSSGAGISPKIVHRHLKNGDMVLMNRQPTLHKALMMGHRVKVLPGEKTLRIHYANTGAYNADFDGDEMNMHFPQLPMAQAEARILASAPLQYVTPTAGSPVRGLIQDHISAGLWVTTKDAFFTREEMQQYVYGCLRPEDGHTSGKRIITLPPTVLKPRPLWTGKQLISTVMMNVTPAGVPGINLLSKNKVKNDYWGKSLEENSVIFHNGELVCGILDKSQYGASKYGMVHAVHELYGAETAAKLLSVLGRLFTNFIQSTAFTCGMEDICLTRKGNQVRKQMFEETAAIGLLAALDATNLEPGSENSPEFRRRLEEITRDNHKLAILDTTNMGRSKVLTGRVSSELVPGHVMKPFPANAMQSMALTGAKGSAVNVTQIMCLLGQQTLEGRRPPVMVSGKSLPCFRAYETHPRAGGYIADRFYSGVRPQEYYFHCMAGREGLIDTAVKTATSGYLQRCLIKQLEGLHVTYDGSVRDSDGTMTQFLYGGDSLDTVQETYLRQFEFCYMNREAMKTRYDLAEIGSKVDLESAAKYKKTMRKQLKKGVEADPVISKLSPATHVGSVLTSFLEELKSFLKSHPEYFSKKNRKGGMSELAFEALMHIKYMRLLVNPGESVGIIAAQSVGEPSTQMTLNTFHFAGHGEANVTLGIPRLREIVMTASEIIKTPQMYLPLKEDILEAQGEVFCKSMSRIRFSELVDRVTVVEVISGGLRVYNIKVHFYKEEEYEAEYNVDKRELGAVASTGFLRELEKGVKKELAAQKKEGGVFDITEGVVATKEPKKTVEVELDADEEKMDRNTKEAVSYDAEPEPESEADSDSDSDVDSDEEMMPVSDSESEPEHTEDTKDRENQIILSFTYVSKFNFDDEDGEWCSFSLALPGGTQKILMVDMVEETCRNVVVREIKGIGRCLKQKNERSLVTEGVNFDAIFDQEDVIALDRVQCNDVSAVLKTYGVEAARKTIINEIVKVFSTYGIGIGPRHLELIADYMTREGSYLAFNRQGIDTLTSAFKKMSYETTCQFLTKAVLQNEREGLDSPSARLVVGALSGVGTGAFDVLGEMRV